MEGSGFDEQIHSRLTDLRAQNTPEVSLDALTVLQKLWENIMNNPEETKFHGIKKTNPALQRRLLVCNGIVDLLKFVGYEDTSSEMMTITPAGIANLEIAHIMLNVHVMELQETTKTPAQKAAEANEAKIREDKRRKEEQKKRILDQAALDRKEQAKKLIPTQDSVAKNRAFGAEQKTYKDIGVDLNSQPKRGG